MRLEKLSTVAGGMDGRWTSTVSVEIRLGLADGTTSTRPVAAAGKECAAFPASWSFRKYSITFKRDIYKTVRR